MTLHAAQEEQIPSRTGRVVVGYDGAPASAVALDWAADEADRLGAPLTVVHVRHLDAAGETGPALSTAVASRIVEHGVRRARERAPALELDALTCASSVVATLVHVSRTARLLVLGTHGGDPAHGAVLGSVAYTVAVHAACPTVVVRGAWTRVPGPRHPVVVGVDGSGASNGALWLAARTAARAGAELIVVTAHTTLAGSPWTLDALAVGEVDESTIAEFDRWSARAAGSLAAEAMVAIHEQLPRLPVTVRVVAGPPGRVLTDETRDAALLVLGTRGWGGLVGVLGSATHSAIHRSACPVVVVPAFQGDDATMGIAESRAAAERESAGTWRLAPLSTHTR